MASNLQRHQSAQHVIRRQMASGRRVNLASDDPGAYEAIRNLYSDMSQLQQFERNSDMARHYLSVTDQNLTSALNLLHRSNELAVRAGDASFDPAGRRAMAEEVNQVLESLINVANSSEGGRYVFSGLRTGEKPYTAIEDPATGRITAVTYQGSEESRMIKTGQAQYAVTNIAGSNQSSEGGIFQTATRDFFESIIQLRDALEQNEDVTELAITERLQGDLDHMINQISLNGARHEQVLMQRNFLREMQHTHLASLNELESVDMAEAAMRLSQAETSYQAALYSSSSLLQQMSLLNFI